MAKAFQCDICNCFYTHTNHQSFYITSTEKRLDICDDCYLKLIRFINKEEEEQKNAGTN